MNIRIDVKADPQSADGNIERITDPEQNLRSWIETAINRRLAKKLGCKLEEVDLMLPSGCEERIQ